MWAAAAHPAQGRGWEASRATHQTSTTTRTAGAPAGPTWTAGGRLNCPGLPPGLCGVAPPRARAPKILPQALRGKLRGLIPLPGEPLRPLRAALRRWVDPPPSGRGTPAHPHRAAGRDREAQMSTSTHTSSTTSQRDWWAGQARRAARADQRRRRRAGGIRGVAGDAGHRREAPQLQPGQPAADRRAGPAGHSGRRVRHLAERGSAGTQGGAGHRDPGAAHLPPEGG